jgi:hypothetical protein
MAELNVTEEGRGENVRLREMEKTDDEETGGKRNRKKKESCKSKEKELCGGEK